MTLLKFINVLIKTLEFHSNILALINEDFMKKLQSIVSIKPFQSIVWMETGGMINHSSVAEIIFMSRTERNKIVKTEFWHLLDMNSGLMLWWKVKHNYSQTILLGPIRERLPLQSLKSELFNLIIYNLINYGKRYIRILITLNSFVRKFT